MPVTLQPDPKNRFYPGRQVIKKPFQAKFMACSGWKRAGDLTIGTKGKTELPAKLPKNLFRAVPGKFR